MKLTRQTKLYKSTDINNTEIIFRTLTITELKVLDSIKSTFYKCEMAYDIGYVSGYISEKTPEYFIKHQIGRDIIDASSLESHDPELFELTVDELRQSVNADMTFDIIHHVVSVLPGTSIEYLLNLTFVDLVELGALCEKISNKKLFNVGEVKQFKIKKEEDSTFFEDDGKSLQDKMKEQSKF